MIDPLDARIIYLAGCLDKFVFLHYLAEKTDIEQDQYEPEQIRIETHIECCEACAGRLERFVKKFNPGDDISTFNF